MKTKVMLFGLCIFLLACPAYADEIPLCEIPNWEAVNEGFSSSFSVYLDSRHHNPKDYGNTSYPEGGVKLELFLWEAVTGSTVISKVEYINTTSGESYNISPNVYAYPSGAVSTEYSIWLGHAKNALGNWRLLVTSGDAVYYYDFAVTGDMLAAYAKPPLPTVKVTKFIKNKVLYFNVTGYSPSYLRGYKVRLTIFEDNGYDVLYRSDYLHPTGSTVKFTIPACLTSSFGEDCTLSNNVGRLEVKNVSGSPWYAYDHGCLTGSYPARTLQNFKFPVVK